MQTRRQFIAQTSAMAGSLGLGLGLSLDGPSAAAADTMTPASSLGLANVLGQAGKPTRGFSTSDGTNVLLLPYGGRVLGLFPPGSEENFYWTNPALRKVDSARDFFASSQWKNSGGDRTWLAPEVDLFFPNFPDREPYFQQRSLDPGNYEVVETKDGFRLVNRAKVKFSRSQREVELCISKAFGPAKNPLRYERGINFEGVEYAGYTQFSSLELTGEAGSAEQVGLWNLIQMPHGGDLLVPTFGRAEPRHIFSTVGTIPPEDLVISDNLVRYRMRQKGEHKIGLRAISVANRIGYLHPTGDRWALIIRNFVVNPSGEYVDVPWTDTTYFGFAVQACNVNSNLGEFSELEYHIPAIGKDTGRVRCDDETQVWAFRGHRQEIEAIAKALLTPAPWADRES